MLTRQFFAQLIYSQRVMKRLQEQDKPKKEKKEPAPVQPPAPKPISRTQTQPIATRQMSEGEKSPKYYF